MNQHRERETADGAGETGLPADVRATLRRLLAQMLVADFTAHPTLAEDDLDVAVTSLSGSAPENRDAV